MAENPIEERILAAIARGEAETAASEIIRGYGPQILGYLRRVLGSDGDAADAFSLFSEQVWRGIAGFAGRSSVRVWAYRVAWSAAMRVSEESWRQRRERLRTSMASRIAAEVQTQAGAQRAADAIDLLRASLTAGERALLVLRLDQKLSWREAAEILCADGELVDEATLRKRFERLKEKMGRLARERGLIE